MRKPKLGRFDIEIRGKAGFYDAEIEGCQNFGEVMNTLNTSDFISVNCDHKRIVSTRHIIAVSQHFENICDKCGSKSGEYNQCEKCRGYDPIPF